MIYPIDPNVEIEKARTNYGERFDTLDAQLITAIVELRNEAYAAGVADARAMMEVQK